MTSTTPSSTPWTEWDHHKDGPRVVNGQVRSPYHADYAQPGQFTVAIIWGSKIRQMTVDGVEGVAPAVHAMTEGLTWDLPEAPPVEAVAVSIANHRGSTMFVADDDFDAQAARMVRWAVQGGESTHDPGECLACARAIESARSMAQATGSTTASTTDGLHVGRWSVTR